MLIGNSRGISWVSQMQHSAVCRPLMSTVRHAGHYCLQEYLSSLDIKVHELWPLPAALLGLPFTQAVLQLYHGSGVVLLGLGVCDERGQRQCRLLPANVVGASASHCCDRAADVFVHEIE